MSVVHLQKEGSDFLVKFTLRAFLKTHSEDIDVFGV